MMEDEIKKRLEQIESKEDVVVCLAVESGSRAWGFPSIDSDYDARFVYVHHPEWYLSIDLEAKRDVIEQPLEGMLDISGWDVRKALKLFRKSNPPLLEWLQCPIIYRERSKLAELLRKLLPEFYSPEACFYHYLHMARGNFREYLRGDEVWRKKYFYLLRPLLAIRWIEKELGPVPIEFARLVEATVENHDLRKSIETLVEEKKAGVELGRGPRIPIISDFVESEIARHENPGRKSGKPPPVEKLNVLFREVLDEIWGSPLVR
jgi:predicted nucleotidyltransferase